MSSPFKNRTFCHQELAQIKYRGEHNVPSCNYCFIVVFYLHFNIFLLHNFFNNNNKLCIKNTCISSNSVSFFSDTSTVVKLPLQSEVSGNKFKKMKKYTYIYLICQLNKWTRLCVIAIRCFIVIICTSLEVRTDYSIFMDISHVLLYRQP